MEILRSINNCLKTREELNKARGLINKNRGNVTLVVYGDSNDLQGKLFGPRGYDENEMDAIKRELRENRRVSVSGNEVNGVVTVVNRRS